jgi:hypothetical protein
MYSISTKNICTYCFISIFLIILFVISPLSKFFKLSLLMKFVIIILLAYTFYLNIIQTNQMKYSFSESKSEELSKQMNMNIICSYVFTLFIGLLIIFVIKSLF